MTQDGSKMASFSIATNESWKDKNTGERIDRTEWHRIIVFNEHFADIIERYVKKGSKVYIEGQLQTRKWTDQQGVERYATEIVAGKFKGELALLDGKASPFEDTFVRSSVDAGQQSVASQAGLATLTGQIGSGAPIFDDEVPF
jgi:single-strand DNA-binding protein